MGFAHHFSRVVHVRGRCTQSLCERDHPDQHQREYENEQNVSLYLFCVHYVSNTR